MDIVASVVSCLLFAIPWLTIEGEQSCTTADTTQCWGLCFRASPDIISGAPPYRTFGLRLGDVDSWKCYLGKHNYGTIRIENVSHFSH